MKRSCSKMDNKRDAASIFTHIIYLKLRERAEILTDNKLNYRIQFSDAAYVLGAVFRIPREFHFTILKQMESLGLIEIKPYHYIILRQKVV